MKTVLNIQGCIIGQISKLEEGPRWFAFAVNGDLDQVGPESYQETEDMAIGYVRGVHAIIQKVTS